MDFRFFDRKVSLSVICRSIVPIVIELTSVRFHDGKHVEIMSENHWRRASPVSIVDSVEECVRFPILTAEVSPVEGQFPKQ